MRTVGAVLRQGNAGSRGRDRQQHDCAKVQSLMHDPSRHRDRLGRLGPHAFLVDPDELEHAGFGGLKLELEIRVGRNRAFKIAPENEFAVELATERVDDHAWDQLAACVLAKARFHDVRNQRLDVDGLAFSNFLFVEPDAGFGLCHDALRYALRVRGRLPTLPRMRRRVGGQPPHPPIVTLICRDAEKKVPSLNLATAMTSWVAASRMRVEASGTLKLEKRNRITRAFGFAGATTRISCT